MIEQIFTLFKSGISIVAKLNCEVSRSAIAFIDRQVTDRQSLIAGVTPGMEVVVLDRNRDAVEQITEGLTHGVEKLGFLTTILRSYSKIR